MIKKMIEGRPIKHRLKIELPRKDGSSDIKGVRRQSITHLKIEEKKHESNVVKLKTANNHDQFQPKIVIKSNSKNNETIQQKQRNFSNDSFPHIHGKQNKAKSIFCRSCSSHQLEQKQCENRDKINLDSYSVYSNNMFPMIAKKFDITLKADKLELKKESFLSLLSFFIKSLIQRNQSNQLNQLSEILKQIGKLAHKKRIQASQKKMTLTSKIVQKMINPDFIRQELKEETLKIQFLLDQKLELQDQIFTLKNKQIELKKVCQEIQKETEQWENKADKTKKKVEVDTKKLKTMSEDIQKISSTLEIIKEQEEKIKNYVLNQTDLQLMQSVGHEFQKLEKEMINYADFLKQNPSSSSLTYKPKSFFTIEKYMRQDLNSTLQLITSKEKTIDEKSKIMVEFVEDSFRKFVAKEEELNKLNLMKTQNVRKFIEMMNRWVDSSEIKKKTLLDLRKQFAVDSVEITNILTRLLTRIKNEYQYQINQDLKNLQQLWRKVEKNYKMGNFFF